MAAHSARAVPYDGPCPRCGGVLLPPTPDRFCPRCHVTIEAALETIEDEETE